MISNRPWGVYSRTRDFSVEKLSLGDPLAMAARSGTIFDQDRSCFIVESFGQNLSVSFPEGDIFFLDTVHSPHFSLCICALNYLPRADGTPLSGKHISYRELENGHVYYAAFRRESINMLSACLPGKNPRLFAEAARKLGGSVGEGADLACTLYPLPRFPVTIKLWFPDDEMEGSANILFDSSANHYLHTEDIAAVGELAARFLVKQYQLLASS
ncbi:MAG: hypothetical protein JL50_03275 [Peptococcaceae bacterium BICA1-7]|nr:MAG: hypothetical protein JL50_03275 [Peptococcaceae bacterium BICA1-7]